MSWWLRAWRGRRDGALELVHAPEYRLPLAGLERMSGFESRRADYALSFLLDRGATSSQHIRSPDPISYVALERVHAREYLERLSEPATMAAIFAVDPSEVPIDPLLRAIRLGCGGTLLAARRALATTGPVLNLFGGFHHAAPSRGAGFCALNDVAVALAQLRFEGFGGACAILDVDAHPPDGTAECLRHDERCWQGSLSGTSFGALPGVDEVVLPQATDADYLAALTKMLGRMPSAELTFVLAGGDVIAGDRLGALSLSENGARERDRRIAEALKGRASVWLPAGGYGPHAWRVLAGTGLVLGGQGQRRIPARLDPLSLQYRRIARSIAIDQLNDDALITQDEMDEMLGRSSPQRQRMLGLFSREGLEHALHAYGVAPALEQLGYTNVRVEIDAVDLGDRLRVLGDAGGAQHVLLESVLQRQELKNRPVLFIQWLSLRHPVAGFSERRPQLPGQDAPGLGLGREVGEMLAQIARRLELAGVVFRPAWFHTAFAARKQFRFVDEAREGRFEALARDLEPVPLREATAAVANKRVLLNGEPYTWEPDAMVRWLTRPPGEDRAAIDAERARCHFTVETTTAGA